MQNHWSSRPQVLNAIKESYKITEEIFASPLNHNMALNSYLSAHRRDSIMGAKFDAFSDLF